MVRYTGTMVQPSFLTVVNEGGIRTVNSIEKMAQRSRIMALNLGGFVTGGVKSGLRKNSKLSSRF
jgi:hypothetical protein